MSTENKDKKEVDIFRDTPVRYLGYANELGESFRVLISPGLVRASYAVAFGYVLMDVVDKAKKTYEKEYESNEVGAVQIRTAKIATDCFLWQTFASVLVPGFTINRLCKLCSILLNKTNVQPIVRTSKILTTAIGLCSIPLIIHPIDQGVHLVMNKSVRPALGIEPHI
jgi:fission process protein 1